MACFFPEDFLEADGSFKSLMPADFVPIVYRSVSGHWYCAECLNRWRAVEDPLTTDDPDWRITGYEFHYEGPPVICDACDAVIVGLFSEDEP